MEQVLSLAGAALVLGAFAGLQLGRLTTGQRLYQLANLVGAGLLCAAALMTQTWGFVVLNAVWGAVAAATLVRPPQTRR
jgi:hypothetical protein